MEGTIAEFIKRSDQIGRVAEGYLKQHFNTPNAYMGLVAALQQRETLLLGVLERFRDVLGEGYRQTTYPQANLILTNILQLTQGKKTDRFAQTFDALATVAVISFERGVDQLDTPLARWVDGARGAEFHLFHGDMQQMIPYSIGFIPDVLKHWIEVRPDVLAKSEALRILGPNLISIIMNCGVLCHEFDDSIEESDGSVQDRICQIISLDPPQLNVWDLVATRGEYWVLEADGSTDYAKFKKIHAWQLFSGYNKLSNNELYYWEDGKFHQVSAEFEPITALNDIEPQGKYVVNRTPVSIPERAEFLYAVTPMTRENTRVSWV